MNNTQRETALTELHKLREDLLAVVNTTVDSLIARLENGEDIIDNVFPCETIYPLTTTASIFKGMKPAAVIFGDERIEVNNWRDVCLLIMRWCDDEKHDALMDLRNKISGRSRTFLSDKPGNMDIPLKINEGLYVEGKFDSEYRVIILRDIMDAAHYDYSGISVAVTRGKRGRQ